MSQADADGQEPVFRLIYRSQSLIPLADRRPELGAVFNTARRNNRRLGITGALIVSEDSFVQALEGSEAAVRELLGVIAEDPRHASVTVLEERTVPARTFGRWAMAKVAEDDGPDIRLLANTTRAVIVAAPGPDRSVTAAQEEVLGFMRNSLALA